MTLLGFKTILHKKCRSGKNSEGPAENSWVLELCMSSKMKTNFKKSGVKQYIILNKSRKHFNYEEDKNKVPMNKPYNIQNTNICNGILHISFFKALLINEGETTRGERE